MSLLSVAIAESAWNIASNLDTAATEFVKPSTANATNQASGTITQSSDSVSGNASYIFGANARVTYSGITNSAGENNFTQEFVFKKSSVGTNNWLASIPTTHNGGGNSNVYLDTNGFIQVSFKTNTTVFLSGTTNLCDNKWHHVVVHYGNGANQARLYVDGTLIESKSTGGNVSFSGFWNLGSSLSHLDFTTAGGVFDGKIDFAAYYRGTYTNAEMDTFVTNHLAEFKNRVVSVDPSTATAVAVQPAIVTTRALNYNASPSTASALFTDTAVSNFNIQDSLEKYMSDSSPEQWYKLDSKPFINSGTGGSVAFSEIATVTRKVAEGPDRGSSVQLPNYFGNGRFYTNSTTAFSTEISDGNFTTGIWFKFPTTLTNNIKDIVDFTVYGTSKIRIFTQDKKIKFNVVTSAATYSHATTAATYNDNAWHFAAIRWNGSTLLYYLDGAEVYTTSTSGTISGVNDLTFGGYGNSSDNYNYQIAHPFIGTYSGINHTRLSGIWSAGTRTLQGGAGFVEPRISNNNAYNDYVETLSPVLDLRFDGSGAPVNYSTRTDSGVALTMSGSSFTTGVSTKNTRGYNFTNYNTYLEGLFNASGLFSDNTKTVSMYAKFVTPSTDQIAFLDGAFGYGQGFWLNLGTSGPQFIFAPTGNYGDWKIITASTSYYGDYHLYTMVRDGTSFKFYIDGKQIGSTLTQSGYNLDDFSTMYIGGGEQIWLGYGAGTVNKNIDELQIFATALTNAQIFGLYQAIGVDAMSASNSTFQQPANTAGFGPTINPGVMYVSTLLVDPTQQDTVAPTILPMTAFITTVTPNFAATKTVNVAADPSTASALFHMPQSNIGENNAVDHMNASAIFPNAQVFIPGFYNDNPKIASAAFVMPAVVLTQGGLVKPQSLNASAQLPLPPAYFTITDDRWYQRLLLVDYQSNNFNGVTTFFNTSTDIVRGGSFESWSATNQTSVFQAFYGYNLTDSPLPKAFAGTYDTQNRKALRIRNIALTAADGYSRTGANWTFETYIKTTKKNQILFVGKENGDTTNPNYQNINAAWRLRDGKISLNNTKSTRLGSPNSFDLESFTGFKDIADGEWHHIIIQNRNSDRRTQVFIDGELDIQRYGYDAYAIHQVGYNSADINAYSDFETSAVASNRGSFVLERETDLNYYAATGIIPVEAATATASATLTANNKARGNRGRALMLYFWPTKNAETGTYAPPNVGPATGLNVFGNEFHLNDQGQYGNNPDTFYPLTTWIKNGASKFYDWDIWPLAVINPPTADQWVGETHPLLKDGVIDPVYGYYMNPVTGNQRYINLMEDLKDISQFDMICFRNYPDESGEQDVFGLNSKGIADEYFNILDKNLFQEFIKSLREAVDTGIGLLITNPQLAVDMGFIDTYHVVDALDGAGNTTNSDSYVPIKLNDPLETGSPRLDISYVTSLTAANRTNAYEDFYRNNYHQVVNTIPGLTDDEEYIWTDEIYYNPDGADFGELSRWWSHIEYNTGLQPGDKFLISSMINAYAYPAVPIESIKAGKVITKFADTYFHGAIERVNPYRNYATSIAVEPGTVVAGKQIGAKVFISFTDNVGIQKSALPSYLTPDSDQAIEHRMVELKSDYWIDIAYADGAITQAQRNNFKNDAKNIDRIYPLGSNDPTNGNRYNALKYWTLNGQDIIGSQRAFGDNSQLAYSTEQQAEPGKGTQYRRTEKGGLQKIAVTSYELPKFSIQWGWTFPIISAFVPSINTRGLRWLSERLEYGTNLPQRPEAFQSDAFMPMPTVVGFKPLTINAQPGLATAALNETNLRSPSVVISVLPLTATGIFVERGRTIAADMAAASALIPSNFRIITGKADEVIVYISHYDPILYIREDVIK